MTNSNQRFRLADRSWGRLMMTLLDIVIIFFKEMGKFLLWLLTKAWHYFWKLINFLSQKAAKFDKKWRTPRGLRYHVLWGTALVVPLILVIASQIWTPQATSYQFGTYVGCPKGWINQNDPDWEKDPLRHLRGGRKTQVVWAAEYMAACGVEFARSAEHRESLVRKGKLVTLEGDHIKLWDVSEPYVTPLMLIFAQRLSSQYYAAECGDLVITSALRNLDNQRGVSNGSRNSIHPTGMSVDLQVPKDARCRVWLQSVLLKIEQDGRIDVTQERRPPHFHVALIAWEYESWLMEELNVDPQVMFRFEELRALTTAIYFESAIKESRAGMLAIASVIKNRRDSADFPNSIQGVMEHGSAGRHNGSCQFSYMCDGKPEQVRTICELHPRDMARLWRGRFPCALRWAEYHHLAAKFMDEPDNTGGAVLYYTGRTPYWAKDNKDDAFSGDLITSSIRKIGNHTFGQSKWLGEDVRQ